MPATSHSSQQAALHTYIHMYTYTHTKFSEEWILLISKSQYFNRVWLKMFAWSSDMGVWAFPVTSFLASHQDVLRSTLQNLCNQMYPTLKWLGLQCVLVVVYTCTYFIIIIVYYLCFVFPFVIWSDCLRDILKCKWPSWLKYSWDIKVLKTELSKIYNAAF